MDPSGTTFRLFARAVGAGVDEAEVESGLRWDGAVVAASAMSAVVEFDSTEVVSSSSSICGVLFRWLAAKINNPITTAANAVQPHIHLGSPDASDLFVEAGAYVCDVADEPLC